MDYGKYIYVLNLVYKRDHNLPDVKCWKLRGKTWHETSVECIFISDQGHPTDAHILQNTKT